MKIIKRNGTEVLRSTQKRSANAVRKANNEVSEDNRLTEEQIDKITKKVTALANDLNRAVNVEEVQDFVENQIMNEKAFAVARKYINLPLYACARPPRQHDGRADHSRSSSANNEEVKQENIQQESHRQFGCSATIWLGESEQGPHAPHFAAARHCGGT